jgi:hypothetical protein
VCTAVWRIGDVRRVISDCGFGMDEMARALRVRVNREESTGVAGGVMPVDFVSWLSPQRMDSTPSECKLHR